MVPLKTFMDQFHYSSPLPQHLEAMQSVDNPYGQAMALVHIAKTYEYMANLNKACETLESVSAQLYYRPSSLVALVCVCVCVCVCVSPLTEVINIQ